MCINQDEAPNIRPDADNVTSIPQTIEYAIRQAQHATAHALCSGLTHVRVELPMGRSRKHWYRMSPTESWFAESSILAFHFAEMFEQLKIVLVLGTGPGVFHPVPWISHVCRVEDVKEHQFDPETHVVIMAAVQHSQRSHIDTILKSLPNAHAYVLLNSFLDTPLTQTFPPFENTYICRALQKAALLKKAHDENWHHFIEIAVFEYEWVGDKDVKPSQHAIDNFALERGAKRKGIHGYFQTKFSGCEAGFWPFMTVSCREVLPMDGALLKQLQTENTTEKKTKGAARPFGFF